MRALRLVPIFLLALPAGGFCAAGPTENLARYARGVFAEFGDDLPEARTHYEAALASDPASFQLARKASAIQLAEDDLATASKTLRTFATAQPGDLEAQLYYADFLEQNAPHDVVAQQAAEEILTAANQRFPHRPEVFSRLINVHENRGHRPQSLELLEAQFQVAEAGPGHWMALAPIAGTLMPGDSPELRERLDTIAERVIAGGIELPPVARYASDYYRQTGRLEEAVAVLVKHVAAAPDSLHLRTRLGLLQLRAKQDAEALETLREVLRIDPEFVLAHRSLAQYYQRQDQPGEALRHHAAVLRIAGGDPADFLEVAEQYLDLEQPREARLLLEKARFDHPEHPGIAARLAIATLREGDTTAAARLFRQAEALAKESGEPDTAKYLDPGFQLEFAHALREAGDPGAAESRLREAIRGIPPEQPQEASRALRALASLWLEQGKNRTPAVSLLKRAEALDPGNPETAALLQQARQK